MSAIRKSRLPPRIIDQNNVAGHVTHRVSQPFAIARPIKSGDRISFPVRQLPGWAAIERLNPDIANARLLVRVRERATITGPAKLSIMSRKIANKFKLAT
jgi:hypothetical protein